MIPTTLLALVPLGLALASGLAWSAYVLFAVRTLRRRPLLLGASLLSTLAPLYAVFTWAGLVSERFVRFERPWLTLPCAAVGVLLAHRLLRLSERQAKARRVLVELAASAAGLAASLAVAGLELGQPLDRLALIVAIDRSRSIDLVPGADSRVASELEVAELGMREDDRIGTLAFAAEAAVEDPLRPRTRLPAPQRAELGRDGTDIGGAIRRALAEVPPDSAARIVLLSDGVSTRGNPLEAAASALAAGVPIDVVPLDQRRVPDVRIAAVRMPPRATEGEVIELRIVTDATADAEVEARISLDGEPLSRGTARIRKGEDVLSLRQRAPGPGLHRYDVELSARDPALDQAPEDNRGSAFVRVRGQSIALVMESEPALAAPMVAALSSAGFLVNAVGPAGVPADIAAFAAYDLLVLSDIRASDLSAAQLNALAAYVRDLGGGLVLMGGDRSLGPGGYGKTQVEDVSPLSFDLKQERRRASLAEVIIIDYSGSMAMRATAQHTKLDLANEAAVRSAELLGAGDRLGVMHVDTVVSWTLPLAPVTDKAAIGRTIRAVGPGGGGIYVDLSLTTAYAALGREDANLKHVLLFADGSDAEERTNAPALVLAAKQRGITTSVVALGRGPDVVDLERLSRLGDGRFYLIEDASRLPAVFAQETILAARSAINEVTFRPSLGVPGAPTRGLKLGDAPPLTGYVVTIPKPRSQVLLRGPEGDPILATWSVGVGRAAAFTSDYKDRWGAAWTSWTGATQLFGQLARDVSRRGDDARVRLEAESSAGQLHVRATVVDDDGRAESFRRLRARVAGPDGFRSEAALEASGPGVYAAEIPLARPGAFVVSAIDELSGELVATAGAVLTIGEELRPTGTDRALLRRIAEVSRGKERDTLAGVFHDRESRRFAYHGLAQPLALLCALLLLTSVAVRRLSLPEWLTSLPRRIASARSADRDGRAAERARRDLTAQTTADALLQARREREAPAPSSVPHFGRPPPVASRSEALPLGGTPAHPVQGAAPPPQPAEGGGAPPRGLSAAEILLARRRGRQG